MSEARVPSQLRAPIKFIRRRLALIRSALGQDISQAGETTYLKGLIHEGFPHSLVDVGAYDGVLNSTSFAFVQSGWRAIMIEPLPKPFKWLSQVPTAARQSLYAPCIARLQHDLDEQHALMGGLAQLSVGDLLTLSSCPVHACDSAALTLRSRQGVAREIVTAPWPKS